MFTPLNIILFGVIALLGVGFYGLLITRNLIKVVLVLQILIKAVILALILAGKMSGNSDWAIHSCHRHRGRHDRCGRWTRSRPCRSAVVLARSTFRRSPRYEV